MLLVFAIGSIGVAANAYATAGRVPNFIFTLIISGALTAVLVPQITKAAMRPDRGQAYIQKFLTLTLVVGSGLTLLTMLATVPLIHALTPGWSENQRGLAVIFALWLAPQVLFFALFAIAGEVLNARSLFGPYAWAPVLNNLVQILGLIIFCVLFGSDSNGSLGTDALASGDARFGFGGQLLLAGFATLGIAAQAIILFLFFKRAGVQFRLDFNWRGVGLRETGKVASWQFGSVVIAQVLSLFHAAAMNRALPHEIGLAAAEFAGIIYVLPHAIIVVSLTQASFTSMSEAANRHDYAVFKSNLSRALSLTVLTMLWCAIVLIILPFEVSRIFQPSANYAAISSVGLALLVSMLCLVPFSLHFVLIRGFYALSDTRTPFLVTAGQAALGFIFTAVMFTVPSSAVTLAVTGSIAVLYFAQLAVIWWLLQRRIGVFSGAVFIQDTVKSLLAIAVAGLGGWLVLSFLRGGVFTFIPAPHQIPNVPSSIAFCAAVILVTGSLYFILLKFMGHSTFTVLFQKILTKKSRH
ncbi:MAG: lipid II flippase MurJ [Microbacteriaceae bacterium]|nr:lipid II flippase MurJ [Microbacteriaceae bacterium]